MRKRPAPPRTRRRARPRVRNAEAAEDEELFEEREPVDGAPPDKAEPPS